MDQIVPITPSWPRFTTPESSQMKEVAYNPVKGILYVQFRANDSVYSYTPVTLAKFQKFKDSPSRGAYFSKNFKKSLTLKVNKIEAP